MSSGAVHDAFEDDLILNGIDYYQSLIDKKFPVLVYAGEFDAQDGPKTQDIWMKLLDLGDETDDFWNQPR